MMNDKRVSKLARENNCIYIPAPHRFEVYPIQVAFGYIVSREERKGYKDLPTALEPPAKRSKSWPDCFSAIRRATP